MYNQIHSESIERWLKEIDNFNPYFYSQEIIGNVLVLLERLKKHFDLNPLYHLTAKKTSIKRATSEAVSRILKQFGESRPFADYGCKVDYDITIEIQMFIELLKSLNIEDFEQEARNLLLMDLQLILVNGIKEFHNSQRINFLFDQKISTRINVQNLLDAAAKDNKAGPVAQHLVGAKLQLRFPEIQISNESTFTADKPTKRQGDFIVGDTVFHVTVSPLISVYQKCKENLDDGLKVYLLVRESRLASARENAYEFAQGRISVQSIETFVSQNIDEISHFENKNLELSFSSLITLYNKRVDASETDKSLMIELPSNLIKGDG
jgi:hypothetical protein